MKDVIVKQQNAQEIKVCDIPEQDGVLLYYANVTGVPVEKSSIPELISALQQYTPSPSPVTWEGIREALMEKSWHEQNSLELSITIGDVMTILNTRYPLHPTMEWVNNDKPLEHDQDGYYYVYDSRDGKCDVQHSNYWIRTRPEVFTKYYPLPKK